MSAPAGEPIRGRPRVQCPICGAEGTVRFAALPDLCHGVPGRWDLRRCAPCETTWLDPEPLPDEIPRLYPASYPTHEPSWDVLDGGQGSMGRLRRAIKLQVLATAYGHSALSRDTGARAAGSLLAIIPGIRRWIGLNNVRLLGAPAGSLLDVGCGNGSYLRTMSRLGWSVEGIEPDARAAEQARRSGFTVQNAPLTSCRLEPASFDAVTMHHVIEHLPDPAAAVEQLSAALRPGGRLVSISPNPECATSWRFGRWWRGFEVPRHLVMPGRRGLLRIAERAGLEARVASSARITRWLALESLAAEHGGRRPRVGARFLALVLQVAAAASGGGDELVLEARRR